MKKLDHVIGSKMDLEAGVVNILLGHQVARAMAQHAVAVLKASTDPEDYAKYKRIRFGIEEDGEMGLATLESKNEAYHYAIKRAAEIACHYHVADIVCTPANVPPSSEED